MWGDVMNVWNWIDNLARGLKKVADESQQNYQQIHAYVDGHDKETLNQMEELVKANIDQKNTDKDKKPSDYSDGIFYEQKTAAAVDIDRTDYADAVKSGTTGILTTKAVTIDKKKYARQSFELLDNDYPLTLERNGSDSAWEDWHAVTNWN